MLTLAQFKTILSSIDTIQIIHDGNIIPSHFHITELWFVDKVFIDCGWTKRKEHYITMQVRVANDIDHRLTPSKLLLIIEMSQGIVASHDLPIVIEYQGVTLGSYHVSRDGSSFVLEPIFTNCLAQDKCGISPHQLPSSSQSCCERGGCC